MNLAEIRAALRDCLDDLQAAAQLGPSQVLVVGVSTSEIFGERIGTHTSLEVGAAVVDTVLAFADTVACHVAFQCCEHLNRALVVSAELARVRGWQPVSAIPVPGAGGAAPAVAFGRISDACLVESLAADAGVDIGDTLIGMHLKRVAVPVRGRRNQVGQAHVVMARTRPPLIGGSRAVYDWSVYQERIGTNRSESARGEGTRS
ncbi:MAG: TIGR01440 family protein [Alicyclobacillus sp.]|nr:TIGR01440 family protein [Alicyclobacillus sp.]